MSVGVFEGEGEELTLRTARSQLLITHSLYWGSHKHPHTSHLTSSNSLQLSTIFQHVLYWITFLLQNNTPLEVWDN